MKRIDFIGAPGVGKTSIYRELLRQRTKKDNWLTYDEAKIKIAEQYILKDKKYLKLVLLKASLFKNIHIFVADRILEKYYNKSLWNKRNEYNHFLSAVMEGILIERKEPVRKLIGINWFFELIREVAFLENSKISGMFLFDESLSQKIYGLTEYNQRLSKNIVRDYFNAMPPPDILIYCYADFGTLLDRLNNRKNRIPVHHGLNNDQLKTVILNHMNISLIAKNILKKRNIPIIAVDTNNNIKTNAKEILNLIRRYQ